MNVILGTIINAKRTKTCILIEIAEDLATSVLATSFFMIHDTIRGSQDDETKLARWQKIGHPFLHLLNLDVEPRRNDSALVQATVQLNDNLTTAMIVDNLELANITVLLHHSQELDDDLGDWTDENLALPT